MCSHRLPVIASLFVLFTSVFTSVLTTGASAQSSPTTWWGEIDIMGNTLPFEVSLEADTGTISIPAQGVAAFPLRDIERDAGTVRFIFPVGQEATWARFTLRMDDAAGTATGSMVQVGQEFPVRVRVGSIGEGDLPGWPEDVGPRRPQTPKEPFPYESVDFVMEGAAGQPLAGTLTIPDAAAHGPGPHPAVVLISGSGQQDRDCTIAGHKPFWVIADHFARHGIATVRYDDRGVGGSGGDPNTSTTIDFAADAGLVVDRTRSHESIDADRVGLVGHSEGGLIAPMVAAGRDDIAFMVLLAAMGVTGREVAAEQVATMAIAGGIDADSAALGTKLAYELFEAIQEGAPEPEQEELGRKLMAAGTFGLDEAGIQAMTDQRLAIMRTPWFVTLLDLDARDSLRKITIPVLAVHGSLDTQVDATRNITEIRGALKEAGNTDITTREMAWHNHLLQRATTGSLSEYALIEETMSPEVLELMTGWIRDRAGLGG